MNLTQEKFDVCPRPMTRFENGWRDIAQHSCVGNEKVGYDFLGWRCSEYHKPLVTKTGTITRTRFPNNKCSRVNQCHFGG